VILSCLECIHCDNLYVFCLGPAKWTRRLLENLTVTQLVKFPVLCGIWKFTVIFTITWTLSWTTWVQFSHTTQFNIYCNIIFPSTPRSSNWPLYSRFLYHTFALISVTFSVYGTRHTWRLLFNVIVPFSWYS